MVKKHVKRYVALHLPEAKDAKELVSIIERGLREYLGTLYPTKVLQVKFIGRMDDVVLLSFHVRELDPHLLIPILSLIKVGRGWCAPLLSSGTVKSLRESLKERYPKLVKG